MTISSGGVVTFSQTPVFSGDLTIGDDVYLDSDAAVIHFGDDGDVTLTHVADTGLLLNSTRQLQFGDSGTYIHQSADGVLDLVSDTEIEINATTIDINGAVDVSGAYTGGGLMTTGGNIVIPDAGNIGSASDTDAIAISSGGVVTMNQIPVFSAGINVSGGTIAGTLATAAQGNVTSLGTLTTLTVDNIIINGTTIGHTSDTDAMTISSGGVVTFSQTPVFSSDLTLGDDLYLDSDGAVIHFGDDGDITLTHTADTGLTTNGTFQATTITATTAVVPDASDGAALGTTSLEWSDLYLADGAVIGFGDDQDVTLTHVADTGLLLNSTMALQFNDASQYINAPSATVLDINATDEVEVNATLMDVNANLDVSGTYTGGGLMTTGGNIVIPDGGNIGSASDTDAIAIGSDGDVTLTQDLELQHDGAILSFGANDDVKVKHIADTGLEMYQDTTADTGFTLTLSAQDTAIEINHVLGELQFKAGSESSGTDALQPAAGIAAIAEGDFTASSNATKLSFKTASSEAASEKMSLSSSGNLTVSGDATLGDDLYLDSDAAVIHLGDDGDVTLTHVADTGLLLNSTRQLQFGDSGTYIHQSADGVLDLVSDTEIEINATTIDINGAVDVSGALTVGGVTTLGGAVAGADQTVARVNLKDYGEVTSALGSGGGSRTIDLEDGNNFTATVSTSTVTWTFSNPTASDELCGFTLFLTNGGSQTVNWPASVDWAGGTAPTLTTSGLDILVFVTTDGGTIWHGMVGSADSKSPS